MTEMYVHNTWNFADRKFNSDNAIFKSLWLPFFIATIYDVNPTTHMICSENGNQSEFINVFETLVC